jgi:hypothetical protein
MGIGLSLVCAVHCAALPLLAGVSGLTGMHLPGGVWTEAALIAPAVLIGGYTTGGAYRRSGNPLPLFLLVAGLALLAAGHFALPLSWESPSAVLGAGLLVTAQFLGRRCTAACCSG